MNEILQKRIEEAAMRYAESEVDKMDNSSYSMHERKRLKMFDGYDLEEALTTFAEKVLQNQWISVEESWPEENGWYLTLNIKSTSPNFADTCQWNAKWKYWYTELCGDVFLHERTHWMQIPSLKGGEK